MILNGSINFRNIFFRSIYFGLITSLFIISCNRNIYKEKFKWNPYDESAEIAENADHPIGRMQYKLIQSQVTDKNKVLEPAIKQLGDFSEEDYQSFMPFIYEKTIPEIQSSIKQGFLSYEILTKWYLYRILRYESNPKTTLHTIIAINPEVVKEARKKDTENTNQNHPIYGMPILLKDNINTAGMATTAGAIVLKNNRPEDAFIVKKLKENGALILGKVNLSEWAYFFCGGCPVGYSAIGGQTLNPYGRRKFETGGSSSGSGTAVAANYAVAAVGTETSGSILSPSSKNSVVGMKPTVGVLSRSGIVPISSTLDTPGPMTKSVVDNAILLSAMRGEDASDPATQGNSSSVKYYDNLDNSTLRSIRLGALKGFMDRDSIYKSTIEFLQKKNVEVKILDPEGVRLNGFISILNLDMKKDLPHYLNNYASTEVKIKTVKDVINFNLQDTSVFAPYGQARLEGIYSDPNTSTELDTIKPHLEKISRAYFNSMLDDHNLDAILSINNYSAGVAAAAKYPALTIPMGYTAEGEPVGLTFISKSLSEEKLLQIAYAFERLYPVRTPPPGYN